MLVGIGIVDSTILKIGICIAIKLLAPWALMGSCLCLVVVVFIQSSIGKSLFIVACVSVAVAAVDGAMGETPNKDPVERNGKRGW